MKYYLHDTNARNDEKVTLLFIEYGYEGIGLFYSILEILASQEKPVRESVLKSQLGIKKRLEKVLKFMYKIEILSLKNGDVFNENILNFSEKYQIKKEKNRKKISEWREKQADTENVTSYKPKCNNVKVNESKVKENNISFDKFWELYNKKLGDKKRCEKKWNKLNILEQQKIISILPSWKKQFSDKKFQPFPETFLNQERWNDEIDDRIKETPKTSPTFMVPNPNFDPR